MNTDRLTNNTAEDLNCTHSAVAGTLIAKAVGMEKGSDFKHRYSLAIFGRRCSG